MNHYCIYHGGCDDGFGAAYAVWKALGDTVEFYPGVHQSDPPFEEIAEKDIIIVDFSYPRPVIERLIGITSSITILDHHKTAAADLLDLLQAGKISGEFDMERSGAMIAWQYFHDTAAPPLIKHIQDRDLWHNQLPHTRAISLALRSYQHDFKVWDDLMDNTEELARDGIPIERFYLRLIEQAKTQAWLEVIGGHRVPVISAPHFMASDLAGELAQTYPFAAVYWDDERSRTYSLRSRGSDGIDVSEIARQYGGGGHKHAAGFKIPRNDTLK